jgi:hypothetical protein
MKKASLYFPRFSRLNSSESELAIMKLRRRKVEETKPYAEVVVQVTLKDLADEGGILSSLKEDRFQLPGGVSWNEIATMPTNAVYKILSTSPLSHYFPMVYRSNDYYAAQAIYRKWKRFAQKEFLEKGFIPGHHVFATIENGNHLSFPHHCGKCGTALTAEDLTGSYFVSVSDELRDFYCKKCKDEAKQISVHPDKQSYGPGERILVYGSASPESEISLFLLDDKGTRVATAQAKADGEGGYYTELYRIDRHSSFQSPTEFTIEAESAGEKAKTNFHISDTPFQGETRREGPGSGATEVAFPMFQPEQVLDYVKSVGAALRLPTDSKWVAAICCVNLLEATVDKKLADLGVDEKRLGDSNFTLEMKLSEAKVLIRARENREVSGLAYAMYRSARNALDHRLLQVSSDDLSTLMKLLQTLVEEFFPSMDSDRPRG